jgi:hypothetical protein
MLFRASPPDIVRLFKNQSDRDGSALWFWHGREMRFEMNDGAEALKTLMRRVKSAMNEEFGEIERGCKAMSALIKVEQEMAAFEVSAAARAAETDEEALRAELRRRIAAFIEADLGGASDDELRAIALAARPQ